MKYQKGQSGNPEGRPSGTPNKTTEELRNTVQYFIENNIETMQVNFDLLEPKDKLSFIEKLLNYSLPKLKATELTANLKDQTFIVLPPNFTPDERDKRIDELKKKLFEEN